MSDVAASSESFNLCVSGAVSACLDVGFPPDVLIPIRPWDKPDLLGKGAGKAPALPDPAFPDGQGRWYGLRNWQAGGFPECRLRAAGDVGANAGIVCGLPDRNYATVDLDPAEGHESLWGSVLEAVVFGIQGGAAWVRHSRPGSHALLVHIADSEPGRKQVFHLTKDDKYIGKVELLTKGEQVAAAGRHYTGVPIHWSRFNTPEDRHAAPPADELPTIATFPTLVKWLEQALGWLSVSGIAVARKVGAPAPGTTEELATRAPDSLTADDLIAICENTPNGAEVDRDLYIAFAQNLSSCAQAVEKRGVVEGPSVMDRVGLAFGDWASRWKGKAPSSQFDESTKWDSDFALHGDHGSWPRVLGLARRFGANVSAYEERDREWIEEYWRNRRQWQAASEFKAEAEPDGSIRVDDILAKLDAAAAEPMYRPVRWSKRFSLSDGGLFANAEGDAPPEWVAVGFAIEGQAADIHGVGNSVVVSWQGRRVIIPKRLCHTSAGEVAALLTDHGIDCRTGRTGHDLLNIFIASVECDRKIVLIDRCGWHATPAGIAFTLPTGIGYGPAADSVLLQRGHETKTNAFRQVGTLEDWQGSIARYAVGNARMALALSVSFVAPLLDIAGEESAGIHLHGESRCGKTTLMVASASVFGKGVLDNGQVGTWRATVNGLEAASAATSDLPQYLDELGQVEARALGQMIYGFANQSGKTRANQKGAARAAYSWRTYIFSTGELTVAAKLAEAGQKPTAGMDARLIDVPAGAGAGMGAFQVLHEFPNSAALVEHLRTAARTFYGTAGVAFLARLADERANAPDALRDDLLTIRREFIRRYVPAGASAQVQSVAGRFGMIAAAGELATAYGILPWPKGEALKAAETCFRAWLGNRGTTGAMEDSRALEQVRAVLSAHGESRFTIIGKGFPAEGQTDTGRVDEKSRTMDRLGFRRVVMVDGEEQVEFLIYPERWTDTLCRGADPIHVARMLLEKGWLIPGEIKGGNPRLGRKVKVPGNGSPRFYCVLGSILADEDG